MEDEIRTSEIVTDKGLADHWGKLFELGLIDIHRYKKNISRITNKYKNRRLAREN